MTYVQNRMVWQPLGLPFAWNHVKERYPLNRENELPSCGAKFELLVQAPRKNWNSQTLRLAGALPWSSNTCRLASTGVKSPSGFRKNAWRFSMVKLPLKVCQENFSVRKVWVLLAPWHWNYAQCRKLPPWQNFIGLSPVPLTNPDLVTSSHQMCCKLHSKCGIVSWSYLFPA